MIIVIGDDWRIASDPLQWQLQKRYPAKDGERWNGVAYFRDIDRALVESGRRGILALDGIYHREALEPLCHALQAIRGDIHAALTDFATQAEAYHGRAAS